jgi:hypothetical protein
MSELEATFNVDEYTNNKLYLIRNIIRNLIAKIRLFSVKNNSTKILTNGNIANSISYLNEFAYAGPEVGITPYHFGNIANVRVYIDPYMRWDDNRILFYDSELIEREPVRKYSELDPFGEENWDENIEQEKIENIVFTLKINDTKGVLI